MNRRDLLGRSLVALGALGFSSGRARAADWWTETLKRAEPVTRTVQGWLAGPLALAQEFPESAISPSFRANGTTDPQDDDYLDLAAKGFVDWRLEVGGLVENPAKYSLDDLRALPARTQITRHDCVEGWSAIAKWKGVPLGHILDQAKPKPEATYVVFRCADSMQATLDGSDTRYYESLDLISARHPQTILAYEMNDQPLPTAHGAPLRLRVERQLGYKMAKYIMRLELVADFSQIRGGKGGYWEDLGYEWYGGI